MPDRRLRAVILELTRRCNLSCLHCGSACDNLVPDDELTFRQWADLIHDLSGMDVEKVAFSGGEATTSPHFEKLVRYTRDEGVRFGVITNGFNLSDEAVDLLRECKPFAVGVSVDGRAASHNRIRGHPESFIRAIDSLNRLNCAGISTAAITALNSFNYRDLAELAPLLERLGVRAWQIQLAMPLGRMKENDEWLLSRFQFAEVVRMIADLRLKHPLLNLSAADCFGFDSLGIAKSAEWKGCSAGMYTLGIKSNGDVLPCLSLYEERFVCGNVLDRPIEEIWHDPDNFGFNRRFSAGRVEASSACLDCGKLNDCRGGCASMSYAYNGYFHDSPFCVDRSIRDIFRISWPTDKENEHGLETPA